MAEAVAFLNSYYHVICSICIEVSSIICSGRKQKSISTRKVVIAVTSGSLQKYTHIFIHPEHVAEMVFGLATNRMYITSDT